MAAIISNALRVSNGQTLISSLDGVTPVNYLYTFIGKALPWPNDTSPPAPIDNLNRVDQIWENMLALKRVLPSDVSLGIKKRNWVYGTYYDIYRHDYGETGVTGISETGSPTTPQSLSDSRYYVVTSNGNIYICIDNNNNQNASTDNPQVYGTGIGYDVFETPDGYKWKYISSVSGPDYAKFSTLEFHPVKTITVEPPANDSYEDQYNSQDAAANRGGAIYNIKVNGGGSSALSSGATVGSLGNQAGINIKGDGTGLQIRANIGAGGAITSIDILEPGTAYTYANITFDAFTTQPNLTPILTPRLGLGADPVYDLEAYYLLINSKLQYAEGDGDFTVSNDYRQLGLLMNPKVYNSSSRLETISADASTTLILTTAEDISPDVKVINTTGINHTVAYTVDWDPAERKCRVYFPRSTSTSDWSTKVGFAAGNTVTFYPGGSTPINATIESVVNPEIQPYSGQIVYYENRRAIQRDASQIEDLHLTWEF